MRTKFILGLGVFALVVFLPAAMIGAPPGLVRAFPGANGNIAFVSDRGGNRDIFVMAADGSGQTNLTNSPGIDQMPVWSADGTKIVFESFRDGNAEIYIMSGDGGGPTRLPGSATYDNHPFWSPDGTRIVFGTDRPGVEGEDEVFVMNADGSGQINLTNNPGFDNSAAWSPDGSKIAFGSNRDGNFEIYVMNADGSGQTNLTANPAYDHLPAWSPDGSKMAFGSNRDGNFEVYVMNADGSGQTRLTNNPADDNEPAWSPDGSQIVFRSSRDGNFEIYVMNADASGQTRLTNNAAYDSVPDWQPVPPPADFKQTDPAWSEQPYGGSVLPTGPCTYGAGVRCTIGSHGCLLSAVADVLTYYGIATNPLLLNNAMVADGWKDGYVSSEYVTRYSGLPMPKSTGYDPPLALSHLSQGEPVIVHLDTGGDGHWVVLTAPAPGGDFYILDPLSSKTLLSEFPPSQAQWIEMYVINGGSSVIAQARSPVAMLLTDPLGRRTGYDPGTGTIVSEIPDSGYDLMGGIENDVTNADGIPGLLSVYTNAPVPGTYTVQITGTGSGPYGVDAWTTTADGTVTAVSTQGEATPGSSETIAVDLPAGPIGGIAELPEVAGTALETAGSSGPGAGVLLGVAAAVAAGVALGGAAWYALRRALAS